MRPEKRRFRPMGVADILDEVVDLYKSNFVLLLGVAAMLYVPISIIRGFTTDYADRSNTGILISLLMLPLEAIVAGALTFGISERYLNKRQSIASCYRRILEPRTLLTFVGAIVLKYAIVIGPLIALLLGFHQPQVPRNPALMTPELAFRLLGWSFMVVIGGIWALIFSTKLLLVEPALVIEQKSAVGSIVRSWTAMRGSFWKALGILMLIGLVCSLIYCIIVGPVLFPMSQKIAMGELVSARTQWLMTVLATIVSTLCMPVYSATRILIYYDVRIRKEAFDLEVLASELDRKAKETVVGDITALPQERLAADQANASEDQRG